MAAPRRVDVLVPSAASGDRVGETAEGESTRVARTQPESRRRFVALLIGGHDGCKSPLSLFGLFRSPLSASRASDLTRERRDGPWAVGCLCMGWSCQSLRCTCLYLLRVLTLCLCQCSVSFGVGDRRLQPEECWSVVLALGFFLTLPMQ